MPLRLISQGRRLECTVTGGTARELKPFQTRVSSTWRQEIRKGKRGSVLAMVGGFVDRHNGTLLVHSGGIDYYGGNKEMRRWLPTMQKIARKHGVNAISEGTGEGPYDSKAWFEKKLRVGQDHRPALKSVEAADREMTQILLDRGVDTSAT